MQDDKAERQVCIIHHEGSTDLQFYVINQTRLDKIRSVKEQRLKMPIGSPYRMDRICCQIPDEIPLQSFDGFGYHRRCYQRFTANLHHLDQHEPENPPGKRLKRDPDKGKQVLKVIVSINDFPHHVCFDLFI